MLNSSKMCVKESKKLLLRVCAFSMKTSRTSIESLPGINKALRILCNHVSPFTYVVIEYVYFTHFIKYHKVSQKSGKTQKNVKTRKELKSIKFTKINKNEIL
jgi:hypothetical protein